MKKYKTFLQIYYYLLVTKTEYYEYPRNRLEIYYETYGFISKIKYILNTEYSFPFKNSNQINLFLFTFAFDAADLLKKIIIIN